MEFGNRLKELRIQSGYTQTELALKLGVNQTTVKNWEKGNTQTDFETLIKLADLFDVTTDYLLGRE